MYHELDRFRQAEGAKQRRHAGTIRPVYTRIRTNRVTDQLPVTVPWDCCIDRNWFRQVGRKTYGEETRKWGTRGNPEGWNAFLAEFGGEHQE